MAYWLVSNYNAETNELNVGNHVIKITSEKVHDILGIPLGGIPVVDKNKPRADSSKTLKMWKSQFKSASRVKVSDVLAEIEKSNKGDFLFKLNWLVVHNTIMGWTSKCTTVNQRFLKNIVKESDIPRMNWCEYLISCLNETTSDWNGSEAFNGPLLFLVVLYVNEKWTRYNKTSLKTPIAAVTNESLLELDQILYENGAMSGEEDFEIQKEQENQDDELGNLADAALNLSPEAYENIRLDDHQFENLGPDTQKVIEDCLTPLNLSGVSTYIHNDNIDASNTEQDYLENIDKRFNFYRSLSKEIDDLINEATSKYPTNIDISTRRASWNAMLVEMATTYSKEDKEKEVDEGGVGFNEGADNVIVSDSVDEAAGKTVDRQEQESAERADSMITSVLKDLDAPSFDLLSQTQEEHEILDDKQENEAPKRPQREKRLAGALKSPYIQRAVKITSKLTQEENMLSQYAFSNQYDMDTLLFYTSWGCEFGKVIFESLFPSIFIHIGVLEAWAHVLNYEEKFRAPGSPHRFFAQTNIVPIPIMNDDTPEMTRTNIMKESIEITMSTVGLKNLLGVDMLFFPMIISDHIVLFVFNLKEPAVELIDNINRTGHSEEIYTDLITYMKDSLVNVLLKMDHPMALTINNLKPVRLKMRWITSKNSVDCGVFTMRHMETYMGGGVNNWDAGLENE